jgi:hypothetical protein
MNKKTEWKLLNLGSNIKDNMLCAFIFFEGMEGKILKQHIF